MLTFKEFEHQAWQNAVEQYEKSFNNLTQQTISAILSVLNIQKDMKFLDIACGLGYLTTAADQKGAIATGLDFSSSMITRARELHPGIDFKEGDAENLHNYPEESFNAVAMNFGILHLSNPKQALQEAYRVLKPGGKIAFTIWCKWQEAIGFLLMKHAIDQVGNPNVELPAALSPSFFSEPENCKTILRQCGFKNPTIQVVNQTWHLQSPDELFTAFFKGSARMGGLLKGQSSEQLAAIQKNVANAVSEYQQQGKIAIPMPAILACGTKD